ncbi:DEAD/DEAH box helicase [Nocardioides ultimimeridianus]
MSVLADLRSRATYRDASTTELTDVAAALAAWAEQQILALESLGAALEAARGRVRAHLPLPAIAEAPEAEGLLTGTYAFTLHADSDTYIDASALGELAHATLPIKSIDKVLLAELRALVGDLHNPVDRRGRPRTEAVQAVNDGLLLQQWFRRSGTELNINDALAVLASPAGTPVWICAGIASAHALPLPPRGEAAISSADLAMLGQVVAAASALEATRQGWVDEVTRTYEELALRQVESHLAGLDLELLPQAAGASIRLAPLRDVGLNSVLDVWRARNQLDGLPGLGADSIRRIHLGASNLRRAVIEDQGRRMARFNLDPSDHVVVRLLSALIKLHDFDEQLRSADAAINDLLTLFAPWRDQFPTERAFLLHASSPRRGDDVAQLIGRVAEETRESGLAQLLSVGARPAEPHDLWDTFRERSVELYGLLGQIIGIEPDLDAVQGHLSAAIAEQVNAQPLRLDLMHTTLRGYQAFGARFALVQRKVILGDEMGLGKTVQALAAMAHLADGGATHFLVVCPAGVLVNWLRETRRHTTLQAHRLHGPERARQLRQWHAHGGVAITTYDTLSRLPLGDIDVAMLVADEAHLLKNPQTVRSQTVRGLVDRAERALFMTGTPIENVVHEFRNLTEYLRSDVAEELDTAAALVGASSFREMVSPVYLRRVADDVLQELPELQTDERWVELTPVEDAAYLDALDDHDFHGLRRVAYLADRYESSKVGQVRMLVDEALSNGRKVLVFSFYLAVLERLAAELGSDCLGTISGSISPEARQGLAERLTAATEPKVLLSQILAGGVGMNLQAASVVILCEPQVKPSLEDQAIKRAHRMGQIDMVTVHRILTPDSVDERLLEILANKRRIIDEYVQTSAVAEVAPEAKDVSDADVAKQVLSAERERRHKEITTRRAAAKRELKVEVCPSCDRPIDDRGHCGCS